MGAFTRVLGMVVLVVLGGMIGRYLGEGNLPVATGLVVVATGVILAFNRELGWNVRMVQVNGKPGPYERAGQP